MELCLRITVVDPPPGIAYALQLGRDQLVEPTSQTKKRITFDFTVEVVDGKLRGPAVQGKPGARFVYIGIGSYAGQPGPGWRAKVSLEGIKPSAKRLEARFAGTGRNGTPACASVPLLEGWK